MTRLNYLLLVLVVFLTSLCIDPVLVEIEEEQKLLVVEGYITTRHGPHTFKVSRSARYGSFFDAASEPEEGAKVFIKDNEGGQVFLDEVTPGVYETPSHYKAEIGKSYRLIINSNGSQYISTAERVEAVPHIMSISARWKKFPSVIPENFKSGVEVYSKFQDPSDEQNFIFWNTFGTFIMHTSPELYVKRDITLPNPIWCPKDCCSRCWFEEQKAEEKFRIYSDANTNGNEVTTLAAYLPDDGGRFDEKYLLRLEQYSLTREAFQFYKLLNDQLEIDGDIFDPPPASITGNIINTTNPDQKVIGYFHASDVYRDSIYIENSIIEEMQRNRQINDDCREVGGVTDPPPYWQ